MFVSIDYSPILGQSNLDQKIDDFYKAKIANSMDTNYIDYQHRNWSLRAFSSFKEHSFHIRNPDSRLSYTPNNRFGLGFGVAYFPVLLDIGFNIKGNEEDLTRRFDMQADIVLKSTYLGLVVQDYEGFNVSGPDLDDPFFRDDIKSRAVHLTYAHAFNARRMSAGSIITGFHQQKKNVGSFLLGGFLSYYQLSADSSIIPIEVEHLFAGLEQLDQTRSFAGGVIGGYGHIFVLPKNFFIFVNFLGGIGLARKKLSNGLEEDVVSNPWIYRLSFRASVGYNGPRMYVILTGGDYISVTPLSNDNWGAVNVGRAKLIFGFKSRKKSK